MLVKSIIHDCFALNQLTWCAIWMLVNLCFDTQNSFCGCGCAADVAGLGTEVQDMPDNNAPATRKPLVAPEPRAKNAAAVKGKAASLIPSIIVDVNATDASEACEPGDMSEDETEMPAIPVELEGAWRSVVQYCSLRSQVSGWDVG